MAVIDALFSKANMKCTVCGAPAGDCDCWERCSCGWSACKGEPFSNPKTKRYTTKVK